MKGGAAQGGEASMANVYYQIIDVTDFGPYVTKLVLGMPRAVKKEELRPEQFSVYVEVKNKTGKIVELPKSFIERDQFVPSVGYREVAAVYPSCRCGGKKLEESEFVTLELRYGPLYKCSSALAANFKNINGHEFYTVCDYRVATTAAIGEGDNALTGLVFDVCGGVKNPKAERFLQGRSSDEKIPMRYGYFVPKKLDGKKPLIIFLHGAGEGGTDTAIAYSGNKVTELTEDWVQEKFGGAFVLVPQCETMWLDNGSGQYNDSGISMYTEALKSLIDEFVRDHEYVIDTDRIYIGGDSNGGFMTMRMIMSYPDYFAAAYPICEAMIDERVTEDDIANLAAMPIWFTHAKNDPIVVPDKYVLPTYKRIMAAGAKNCHFTFWDRIVDLHAGFKQENGEPYEYMGHFAWIPMLNDDCRVDFDGQPVVHDGKEVTLMDWLALQRRSAR